MQNNDRWREIGVELKAQAIILGSFILLIWAIEIVDWLIFRGSLDGLGIRPRTLVGLRGILFAPLLHGGFGHVAANTIPFLVLGWLILSTRGLSQFLLISGIVIIVSGLGTWLIGPGRSVHLGASGLIFGYFGFLLLLGYFERSAQAILLAVVVVIFYGGLIWGVLPQGNGISWQGHLFGLAGGGLAAYWIGNGRISGTHLTRDQWWES